MATLAPVAVPVILKQAIAVASHDTQAKLAALEAPTLVIHGTEDEILPFVNAEIIAGAILGARFEVFEDVGHLWWWEQPDHSASLILEHVHRAPPAGRAS
jgi:pimeloyl-ACP methyl ester carboxylesterase